jgi:hypothetical protein
MKLGQTLPAIMSNFQNSSFLRNMVKENNFCPHTSSLPARSLQTLNMNMLLAMKFEGFMVLKLSSLFFWVMTFVDV